MTDKERPVVANVILRSISGKSVREARLTMTHHNVHEFLPRAVTRDTARNALSQRGFHIDFVAETHLSISGPKDLFQQVFQVRLVPHPSPYITTPKERDKHHHHASTVSPSIPPEFADSIEAISFPGPVKRHTGSVPPTLPYYHLRVPDDIARGMDALRAHANGITGAGIRLAIVDTGFMTPPHPYYANRGYNIQDVVSDPLDPSPGDDSLGHGTSIAACALAVAPGAILTVYKEYSNTAAAFARAVAGGSHIISCSWEEPEFNHALHLAINHAVWKGIVVVFSCGNALGNDGPVGWPGCEPAVISVGGAFIHQDGAIEAANYASSGRNPNEPGRQVPDLCGIVGMRQYGVLIALPTQPDSDRDRAGATTAADGTAPDDGWAVSSGTSAAAPMVAGVAALAMQANPALVGKPEGVRALLSGSCFDVTTGVSASGEAAGPGKDPATGDGLAQAYRAISGGGHDHGQQGVSERGRTKMGNHDVPIVTWLFLHVADPQAAAAKLHNLVLDQQWNPDWSIKQVDTVDLEETRTLKSYAAPENAHNLLVLIKARDKATLQIAFLTIARAAEASDVHVPHGRVLYSSIHLNIM